MRKQSIFNAFLFIAVLLLNMTGCSAVQKIPDEIQNSPSYQALSRVHAEVLSIHTFSAEDVEKVIPNLEGALTENAEHVTKITVGFRTEDAADAEFADLSRISFCKRNGKPISGTAKNYYWRSNNGCCAIDILIVSGKIKASDISYTLQSASGDITFQNALQDSLASFDNYEKASVEENGQPAVFEMGGIHYINIERYNAEPDCIEVENGFVLRDARRYVLVPLDGWKSRSPDVSCLKFDVQTRVQLPDNISVSAGLTDEDISDNAGSGIPGYRMHLDMAVDTYIEAEICKSGYFDEDIIRRINREVLETSDLTIDDKRGNTVRLSY